MALSDGKIIEYNKRLLLSRMRVLLNNGFYGLLLMHMILTLDEECKSVATDGNRIYFAPKFLDTISDDELDFVMVHEILHVALRHCFREVGRDTKLFDDACDIVVNSNILLANNMDKKSITLKNYGVSKHKTPDNKEGYKFTAEEIYNMLLVRNGSKPSPEERNMTTTFEGTNSQSSSEINLFDEQESAPSSKKQPVVKSNDNLKNGTKLSGPQSKQAGWDNHDRWKQNDTDALKDTWLKRIVDAAEAIEIQEASKERGTLPLFAKRLLKDMKKPQTDWRTILTDFVQEEVCDYSFSPPDRRFDDSPFYLPDFNGKDFSVSNILFMVDTSGSMDERMISTAYSEIKGAIEQFDGKLKGWLGFFDAAVIEPKEFESIDELEIIRPRGGGGTDFDVIFEYVDTHMVDDPPVSIVILTDGYAPFPNVSKTKGIPVLWLLNNEDVNPPWGKVARVKI